MTNRFQHIFHALGSEIVLTLIAEESVTDVRYIFDLLHNQIALFESRFSRFLDTSELTAFNRMAGKRCEISEEFHQLLKTAKEMSQRTDGLYNPFVLPALQKAGYVGSWPNPQLGSRATDFTKRQIVSADELNIETTWASIPADSAIDFGGIGKGYLLDELATTMTHQSLADYWFSLGGDIICSGFDVDHLPWTIAIQDIKNTDTSIDTIINTSGATLAIATSGVIKRRGTHNGKDWHHIIDPRTGSPSDTDILAATVSADRAVVADVYAKCIVITGSEQAATYKTNKMITSYVIQSDIKGNKE